MIPRILNPFFASKFKHRAIHKTGNKAAEGKYISYEAGTRVRRYGRENVTSPTGFPVPLRRKGRV